MIKGTTIAIDHLLWMSIAYHVTGESSFPDIDLSTLTIFGLHPLASSVKEEATDG